ncbi:MAG: hypothetical protein AAFW89_09340 [Bacteroidota bacterium]
MIVDRCVCHNVSFEIIKELAAKEGIRNIEELQMLEISSTKCKMCRPYIEMMFETGETKFRPGTNFERLG